MILSLKTVQIAHSVWGIGSIFHAQCPMPNAQCPIIVGQWGYN
ncbi:MAG: hypothetical protein V7L04_22775 [Nostoc sp.]|nr:hypothetical protein [Nostoc sp. S13]MDF5736534.1 hypothetical protein [Nostoc sp. S13]